MNYITACKSSHIYKLPYISCKGEDEGGDTAGMGEWGEKRGKLGRLCTAGR